MLITLKVLASFRISQLSLTSHTVTPSYRSRPASASFLGCHLNFVSSSFIVQLTLCFFCGPTGNPRSPGGPWEPRPSGEAGRTGTTGESGFTSVQQWRPCSGVAVTRRAEARAYIQTGSPVSQAEQLPVRQILFLMPQPVDCASANGNPTVGVFPSHLGRRRVGRKQRYLL